MIASLAQRRVARASTYLVMVAALTWILFPVFWLAKTSLQSNVELFAWPPSFVPRTIDVSTYANLFMSGSPYGLALFNSLTIAAIVTALTLTVGALAAYAFVRLRVPFSSALLLTLLATQLLPDIVPMIPLYSLMTRLNLIDTKLAVVTGHILYVLPPVIWLLYGYFQQIPSELEEAALIDGCSRVGALRRVVLPVTLPAFLATGALAFVSSMNEFIFAFVFTNSYRAKTVPVVLTEFIGKFMVNYGSLFAGATLAAMIPVVLFIVFQRYLVIGLTAGAVKE